MLDLMKYAAEWSRKGAKTIQCNPSSPNPGFMLFIEQKNGNGRHIAFNVERGDDASIVNDIVTSWLEAA